MNDNELASGLAAMGIGQASNMPLQKEVHYRLTDQVGSYFDWMSASMFLSDPRVAMDVLQAWPTTINTEHLDMTLDEMLRDPRAICEAGYEV